MGNRPPERAFALRALDVNVYPLPVTRAFRELRNPFLVDADPGRDSKLLADLIGQLVHRQGGFGHDFPPLGG
jgi:hypothetical protein